MKIIIADDNAAVRMSLKMVLREISDDIATIGDPKVIPAIVQPGNVDVVLLDMNFDSSKLDGSDGLFWLHAIKENPDAPAVVMITAFGDVPLAVQAMKEGAEDFVAKPWDNDELIRKVKKAVENNRLTRQQKVSIAKAEGVIRKEELRDNMTLEELRLDHINNVISQCGGNLSAAAKKLDINRQTLYNLLRKQK